MENRNENEKMQKTKIIVILDNTIKDEKIFDNIQDLNKYLETILTNKQYKDIKMFMEGLE
ncbi:MAG: hypothetical protein QXY20_09535 [Thermofilum sp.]|uniref:hypothetical protein n=1 Tax=Thermofilum sp. TaxID=1961369 RepID=UPI003165EF02